MECEYCGNVIKTQGALKKHQNTAPLFVKKWQFYAHDCNSQ